MAPGTKGLRNKKAENAKPNRTDKRRNEKWELATAKRATSNAKPGVDLKNMPKWMQIAGVGIVFSFCGGAALLEAIPWISERSNALGVYIAISIVVLGVAGCGWWYNKIQESSNRGTKVLNSRGEVLKEKIHGKWREKMADTTPRNLTPTTAVQRKERQPHKKYRLDETNQTVPQAAIASPVEFAQAVQAAATQQRMTLDTATS